MLVKPVQRVVFAVIVILLLLASFIAGRMNNEPMNVLAQEVTEAETQTIGTYSCVIKQVAMYHNRAHVMCTTPLSIGIANIYFFAVEDTPANKALINRVLAIGLTQMSMDRSVTVQYESDYAENPPGCGISDCRKLVGIMGFK